MYGMDGYSEATIAHQGTAELYANVLTKPLQGSQFVYERGCLTGWPSAVEEASVLKEIAAESGVKGTRSARVRFLF
jgi:hypothetical protein